MAGRTDLIGILPRRFAEELADGFNLALYETPMPITSQSLSMIWHERNDRDIGHRWPRQRLADAASDVFVGRGRSEPEAGREEGAAERAEWRRSLPPAQRLRRFPGR